MRVLIIISSFFCLQALSRPTHEIDNGNSEEVADNEYDADDEGAAEYNPDESEQRDQESQVNARKAESSRKTQVLNQNDDMLRDEKSRVLQDKAYDNFPEYKKDMSKEDCDENLSNLNSNRENKQYIPQNDINKHDSYEQNNNVDESLTDDEVNNEDKSNVQRNVVKGNDVGNNADTFTVPSDNGELLFENGRQRMKTNNIQSNDDGKLREHPRFIKGYYNALLSVGRDGSKNTKFDHLHRHTSRDKRQVQSSEHKDNIETSTNASLEDTNIASENEENIIKKHVKKLSGEELEELLNSLSEDKRTLLKKIINDDRYNNNNDISKREIIKKADAVEENNYMDRDQSDISKSQGELSAENTEISLSQKMDTTETTLHTEMNELPSSKSDLTVSDKVNRNKVELSNEQNVINSDASSKQSIGSNLEKKNEDESKNGKKREINYNDYANIEMSEEDQLKSDTDTKSSQEFDHNELLYSENDNLYELLPDEPQSHDINSDIYKREVEDEQTAEIDNSINTLEDSFPSADIYRQENPNIDSNLPSLVRVKRNTSNMTMNKRDVSFLLNAKVPFLPSSAENDDEDNEEGSEFQNDGFYDRSFSKNYEVNESKRDNYKKSLSESESTKNELETDQQLGSDTDSVLSGADEIDENLMHHSIARDKRTAPLEISSKEFEIGETKNKEKNISDGPSTFLHDRNEIDMGSNNNVNNSPHYQENDAFGALPRNYDSDFGRYKRIRHVKQSPAAV